MSGMNGAISPLPPYAFMKYILLLRVNNNVRILDLQGYFAGQER